MAQARECWPTSRGPAGHLAAKASASLPAADVHRSSRGVGPPPTGIPSPTVGGNSLDEGLEETFTLHRLGVFPRARDQSQDHPLSGIPERPARPAHRQGGSLAHVGPETTLGGSALSSSSRACGGSKATGICPSSRWHCGRRSNASP